MRRDSLTEVDASLFFEGMRIPGDLFYNYNNNFVLLCSRCTLSDDLMLRLQHCQQEGWLLYVDKGDIEHILKVNESRGGAYAPEPSAKKRTWVVPPKHLEGLSVRLQIVRQYREVVEAVGQEARSVGRGKPLDAAFLWDVVEAILRRLDLLDMGVVLQCINMMRDTKDYSVMHYVNIAILNGMAARWLNYDGEKTRRLIATGFLLDLGRSRLPEAILDKPEKLTPEEYQLVKSHVKLSLKIAEEAGVAERDILEGIAQHHERLNGSGYPQGLSGDQIGAFARVSAISDAYDAMTAGHRYKKRRSPFSILQEFSLLRLSQYDPGIVNTFVEHIAQELVDKLVDLSDGRKARVVYLNSSDYSYPIVRIKDQIIHTNEQLYCTGMSDFLSLME